MSLVVALNLDDYAILATDKRGVMSYRNKDIEIDLRTDDHYQKLRQVPFGFFSAAGDYAITEIFYQECMLHKIAPRTLDQIVRNTYDRYINEGGSFGQDTNILLIAKSFNNQGDFEKDTILQIKFKYESIETEDVAPMSLISLMAKMNPDPNFWDKVGTYLRSSETFKNLDDFFNYHLHLIQYIWKEQLKFDNLISHHIDFYFHDKRVSKGIFLSAENFKGLPAGTLLDRLLLPERVSTSD